MLDQTTKKRIDNACDILVGKVPTPLAQVEQITLALIYKFMADMDKRSLSIGGQASYFTGDYEKYSWDNLMDTRIGAQERANLYEEGLNRLSTHSGLPELFRGIFKEASVPYRSSHTLNLFLKEIDHFSYEDSENLGDAYEYLLGKTGSQGEAGQFRTPRHIIDFIVQVVDPNKHDTILDPACGTAGFLISALKHIYRSNTKEIEGDLLSTQELIALSNNVFGYDITPDMVRISRVNMFLHNIKQPHIYEYDTLSSLDRWEDTFSCILANPPFMTPKGGVVPHNRFSIKSTRSEVLFVDYILEHLTLDGKAGIIVPEGIIFQSGKAHTQLRKKLVEENYLVGVISLPNGVFNPYSPGKTSVLWIDRSLARKIDTIIFLKISNDGYELGAKRRPIPENDIPPVLKYTQKFLSAIRSHSQLDLPHEGFNMVNKAQLAEKGDYSFITHRYTDNDIHVGNKNTCLLGELLRKTISINPSLYPEDVFELWSIPSYDTGTPEKLFGREIGSQKKVVSPGDVLLSRIVPHIRRSWVVEDNKSGLKQVASTEWIVFSCDRFIPSYLRYLFMSDSFHHQFMRTVTGIGGSLARANVSAVSDIRIPLPPLSVQADIVAEIQAHQKAINHLKEKITVHDQAIKDKINNLWT